MSGGCAISIRFIAGRQRAAVDAFEEELDVVEGPDDATASADGPATDQEPDDDDDDDVDAFEEELNVDEGPDDATASTDGPATDQEPDVDDEDNDDDVIDDDDDNDEEDDDHNTEGKEGEGTCTPQQDDWIIVTSHDDNTIRFRNSEASKLKPRFSTPTRT